MILDTNALSAFADGDPALHPEVSRGSQLCIPVIVLGEFRYGIAASRYRAGYLRWLERFVGTGRVLEVTDRTTHNYATIRLELRRAGKPIPTNDTWIAALCRQHGLPLLSRDRHFDAVPGIDRIEW